MMVLKIQTKLIKMEWLIVSSVILSASYIQAQSLSAIAPRTYHVGETATLVCAVKGFFYPAVVWRRTSDPNPLTIGYSVNAPDDRISVTKSEQNWNLVITNVGLKDAGAYECSVYPRKTYKKIVLLRVKGMTEKKVINKGSRLLLLCNATADQYDPYVMDWFFNGIRIDQQKMSRVKMYNTIDGTKGILYSSLEITPTLTSDKGTYICRGRNSQIAMFKVDISNETREDETVPKGPVTHMSRITLTGEKYVSEGSRLLLLCNATGEDNAPDRVDWFFNGLLIRQQMESRVKMNYEIDHTKRTIYSTLEIKPALMSDRGVYICRGPNSETDNLFVAVLVGSDTDSGSSVQRPTLCKIITAGLLSVLLKFSWFCS